MSYTVKSSKKCSGCGRMTNRRERVTCEPLCISCAIQKATDVQIQMQQKSGPHYDKWRKAMMRTFAK